MFFKNKKYLVGILFFIIILFSTISIASAASNGDLINESNYVSLVSESNLEDTLNIEEINTDLNNSSDNDENNITTTETILYTPNISYDTSSYGYFTAILKDIEGNPLSGKNISLKISEDSNIYQLITDENGSAKLKISKIPKIYTITTTFLGDDEYSACENLSKLTIKKSNTKIIAKTSYFIPKSGKYFIISLKDSNNNLLAKKALKVTLNKKTYKLTTNSKGQAKLKIKLSQIKAYKIIIRFYGDSYYKKSSKTSKIIIKKFSTKIIASNATFIPNSGKYYTITLKDQYNNLLVGKKVKFGINNKTYIRTTNSKGQAKLKISLKTLKKFKITTKFIGTSKYLKSSKTRYISIKKGKTQIIANKITCKANNLTKYIVNLKDGNGKTLEKRKVKLNLNNKTYTKITNSKGQATFTIKIPENFEVIKNYTAKITFNGDYQYLKSSKYSKITVISRENTFIKANNITTRNNTEVTFEATLYGNGNFSNKTIEFIVSGINTTYTLITDENGSASFNFSGDNGVYTVTVIFRGNEELKNASQNLYIVVNNNASYVNSSDIINTAINLKNYIDKNLKLPSNVNINETTYSLVDFAYMSGKLIDTIYKNEYFENELIKVENYIKLTNTNNTISKSINLTDYSNLISNFVKSCEDSYNNTQIWQIPNSLTYKESDIEYIIDFKVYLYSFLDILNTYNNTGSLANNIMFRSSAYSAKNISMNNIIYAGKLIANGIENGSNVFPQNVTINKNQYTIDEFIYLMTKTIINIKNNKTSNITLINISSLAKSSGNWTSINITSTEYANLATKVIKNIESNHTLSSIKTSKGYADKDFYIYAFSNVLKYYSSKKTLPSSAAENTVYMYLTGTNFKHGFNEKNNETNLDKYLKLEGRSAATSEMKNVVTNLIKNCKTTWEKVEKIMNYALDRITFDHSYENSKYNATGTYARWSGDCCDQANLIVSLLRAGGIYTRYAHSQQCSFISGNVLGHVWAQALIGNVWVDVDLTSHKNSLGYTYNVVQSKTDVKTINIYTQLPF